MRSLCKSLLPVLLTASLAAPAFAKGGTPQNHHCMKDGAELAGKTRKECKKEGGTWEKMTAAAKPAESPKADSKPGAPATAPAAKPEEKK